MEIGLSKFTNLSTSVDGTWKVLFLYCDLDKNFTL